MVIELYLSNKTLLITKSMLIQGVMEKMSSTYV